MDFRIYLMERFNKRKEKNPHYSLRAFARDLKYSPASLSAVLNGKRPLTRKTINQLGEALKMTPEKLNRFHPTAKQSQMDEATRVFKFHTGKPQNVSNFEYFNNLTVRLVVFLPYLKGFQDDPSWMAKKLGCKLAEAKEALSEAVELGLLEYNDEGKLERANLNIWTWVPESKIEKAAYRRSQIEAVESCLRLAGSQPIEESYLKHFNFVADDEWIPELEEKLTKYIRQLQQKYRSSEREPKDGIWTLQFGVFKRTK